MDIFVYPAVFYKQEGETEFTVVFPDLDIYTAGDNIARAFLLAKEFLRVYLTYALKYDIDYKLPSSMEKISGIKYAKDQQVMLIDAAIDVKKLMKSV